MRDNDIRAKAARKFRHTTDSSHSLPVADNVLGRLLEAAHCQLFPVNLILIRSTAVDMEPMN
jgi:hypothetical protein